jgi:hypothetical protein
MIEVHHDFGELNTPAGPGIDASEALLRSVSPAHILYDGIKSANSDTPFGIGFARDNPDAVLTPYMLEVAAVDSTVRGAKIGWELGVAAPSEIAMNSWGAAGNVLGAFKDLTDVVQQLALADPMEALEELQMAGSNFKDAGNNVANIVLTPAKAINRAADYMV